MKKHFTRRGILIAVFAAALLMALAFCVLTAGGDIIEQLSFRIESADTVESVSVYRTDGVDYVFLPSYAAADSVSLVYPAGCEVYIDDEKYSGEGFFSDFDLSSEYPVSVKNAIGLTVYSGRLAFRRSENIPALAITLIDGTLEDIESSDNKAVRKTGTCSLITSDGKADYIGEFNNMSGRGNSTWLAYKRPYNLRFKQSTSLLSMKSAEKYCLLANAYDTSSLRDKIAYEAARELGMSDSVESEFIDLYVNGEYLGLYLMTQSVEAGEGRQVDIADLEQANADANPYDLSKYDTFSERGEDTLRQGYDLPSQPDDISGGYLIETDLEDRVTKVDSYFKLSADELFHVKSPGHVTRDELDYIADIFEHISKGEELSKYIDFDSWAGLFLIKEFFGDTEGSSLFFYKDSGEGKVYGGPVWDCDLTMGLAWKATPPSDFRFFTDYGILGDVYRDPAFKETLISRYEDDLLPIIEGILSEKLSAYVAEIRSSYDMDKLRWMDADKPNWVVINDSIDADAAYISDYIAGRRDFLNSAWLDGTEYASIHCITEVSNDNVPLQYYFTVPVGGTVPELPTPEDDDYTFEGWYLDSEFTQPVSADMTVNENITLRAKWSLKDGRILGKLRQALNRYLEYGSYRELNGIVALLGMIALMALITLILVIKEIRDFRRRR